MVVDNNTGSGFCVLLANANYKLNGELVGKLQANKLNIKNVTRLN